MSWHGGWAATSDVHTLPVHESNHGPTGMFRKTPVRQQGGKYSRNLDFFLECSYRFLDPRTANPWGKSVVAWYQMGHFCLEGLAGLAGAGWGWLGLAFRHVERLITCSRRLESGTMTYFVSVSSSCAILMFFLSGNLHRPRFPWLRLASGQLLMIPIDRFEI